MIKFFHAFISCWIDWHLLVTGRLHYFSSKCWCIDSQWHKKRHQFSPVLSSDYWIPVSYRIWIIFQPYSLNTGPPPCRVQVATEFLWQVTATSWLSVCDREHVPEAFTCVSCSAAFFPRQWTLSATLNISQPPLAFPSCSLEESCHDQLDLPYLSCAHIIKFQQDYSERTIMHRGGITADE